jgi:formate-dependent nitrite reductase cytochrome c552 subunit
MEHARHVFRALLVLVVIMVVISLGRGFLIPRSFGLHGPYRYDNVAEQMAIRPPQHGGVQSCAQCHDVQAQKRAAGSHKTVSCEVCHGTLSLHVSAGKRTAPMPVDRAFTLCARCHRKILGRPEKFPQVVLEQHVQGPVQGQVCLDCHDPHTPKL